MNNFMAGWYVLYTRPRHEKKVAEQLCEQKLEYYLPLLQVARNWADRVKLIYMPMFPSYIFIYLRKFNDYFITLQLTGVLHYVKFGGQAAKVTETIIRDLRLVEEYGRNVEVLTTEFQQGQVLTISEGPFAGMHAEVVQHNKKEKILVRISLLQRNVLMEMPAKQLVRI